MSRNCFVPSCKKGYPSTRSTNKLLGICNETLFKAPKVFVSKVIVNIEGVMQTATDFGDIEQIIAIVNNLQACNCTGFEKSPRSDACTGYVNVKKPDTSLSDVRCNVCSKERKNILVLQRISTLRHRERKQNLKKLKSNGKVKNIIRRNRRLNNKV